MKNGKLDHEAMHTLSQVLENVSPTTSAPSGNPSDDKAGHIRPISPSPEPEATVPTLQPAPTKSSASAPSGAAFTPTAPPANTASALAQQQAPAGQAPASTSQPRPVLQSRPSSSANSSMSDPRHSNQARPPNSAPINTNTDDVQRRQIPMDQGPASRMTQQAPQYVQRGNIPQTMPQQSQSSARQNDQWASTARVGPSSDGYAGQTMPQTAPQRQQSSSQPSSSTNPGGMSMITRSNSRPVGAGMHPSQSSALAPASWMPVQTSDEDSQIQSRLLDDVPNASDDSAFLCRVFQASWDQTAALALTRAKQVEAKAREAAKAHQQLAAANVELTKLRDRYRDSVAALQEQKNVNALIFGYMARTPGHEDQLRELKLGDSGGTYAELEGHLRSTLNSHIFGTRDLQQVYQVINTVQQAMLSVQKEAVAVQDQKAELQKLRDDLHNQQATLYSQQADLQRKRQEARADLEKMKAEQASATAQAEQAKAEVIAEKARAFELGPLATLRAELTEQRRQVESRMAAAVKRKDEEVAKLKDDLQNCRMASSGLLDAERQKYSAERDVVAVNQSKAAEDFRSRLETLEKERDELRRAVDKLHKDISRIGQAATSATAELSPDNLQLSKEALQVLANVNQLKHERDALKAETAKATSTQSQAIANAAQQPQEPAMTSSPVKSSMEVDSEASRKRLAARGGSPQAKRPRASSVDKASPPVAQVPTSNPSTKELEEWVRQHWAQCIKHPFKGKPDLICALC